VTVAQQVRPPPKHDPPLQKSPLVHMSPSSHGLPSAGRETHEPNSHESSVHGSKSSQLVTSRATQLGPTYHRVTGILRARMVKFGVNVNF